jgi:hypothetical protein
METPIDQLQDQAPMNYSDVLQTMNEPLPQQDRQDRPVYQNTGPPLPQLVREPYGPDIREQIRNPIHHNPKDESKQLIDKSIQHELICIIVSCIISNSDPIQNVLLTSFPNIFPEKSIIKTIIQGIIIGIIFVLLKKITLNLV